MTEWREDHKYFSGLGKSDRHHSAWLSRGRILTDQKLAAIYLHTRFGRLIVDRPAEDCTRRGWKVEVDDSTDGVDPFAEELRRLRVRFKLREAHQKVRVYGGAAILLILDDDGVLNEPVQGKVRGIKALHVLTRPELRPATWYTDIEDPNFGKPETYWLHPNSRRTAHANAGWGDLVHADRVIRFEGLPVPKELQYDYDGWGQSVIEAVWQELVDINVATDSVREAIDQFQYSVLKLKNLKKILTGPNGEGDNSQLRGRINALEEGKELTRLILIDAEDDFKNETSNFTGLIEAYQIKQQNLSAVTRIPITLLFGQSPSGLSTDDQSGTRNYYDGISAMQEEKYEPSIVRICDLLAQAGVGPADGWRVKFHALLAPSEKEEAEIRKIVADADAVNIDRGVYGPEEARKRYTTAGFDADLVVSDDAPEDDNETYQAMMQRLQEIRESGGDLEAPDLAAGVSAPTEGSQQDREFNGEQISSMADVVTRVAEGTLPEKGAIEILMLGFNISEDHARRFFQDKQIKKPEDTTSDDAPQDQRTPPPGRDPVEAPEAD